MTRVDFYILQQAETSESMREIFACRLAEKALASHAKTVIQTGSSEQSILLDNLLWENKPESFVPHAVCEPDDDVSSTPVIISHHELAPQSHQVLINLTKQRAGNFSQFDRVIEIVDQDAQTLIQSRKNYAYYKERGYSINTHKI